MDENQFIELAIQELESPRFGVTEQLLEVHEVVTKNGRPKVERVDSDEIDKNETVIVYFPLVKEPFFLAIYIDTQPKVEVRGIGLEFGSHVYFTVTSETYNFQQLQSFTTIVATKGWSKGDWRGSKKISTHTFSRLSIEPNPGVDALEQKICKLLDVLERDSGGIVNLTKKQDCNTWVHIGLHAAYEYQNMGINLDEATIKRLADLNLSIDFDQYVYSNRLNLVRSFLHIALRRGKKFMRLITNRLTQS